MDDKNIVDLLDSLENKRLKSWTASFVNGSNDSPHSLILDFEGGYKLSLAHELSRDQDGSGCNLRVGVNSE